MKLPTPYYLYCLSANVIGDNKSPVLNDMCCIYVDYLFFGEGSTFIYYSNSVCCFAAAPKLTLSVYSSRSKESSLGCD